MDRPKLSVIIPTKNHAHLLEECLSSLSKQEFRDFEVVVVDGHSTDHTAEVARRYGARIVYEDYGTRAGACLVGFREARGEILVYTDDDCTFPPDWLKRVEEAFRKDRELQVYGGEDVIPPNSSYFEKALFQLDLAKGP
ncbi:MAG: glycosyltransferase family A protein, partial [Candidatus Hadarchaeales archaeon]